MNTKLNRMLIVVAVLALAAIMAAPSAMPATTTNVTIVTSEAGGGSVVDVLPPGRAIMIAARNTSGDALALVEGQGWIKRSAVQAQGQISSLPVVQNAEPASMIAEADTIAIVYAAPDSGQVVDVITPGQQVRVSARSAGGDYLALAEGQGWVKRSAVRSQANFAQLAIAQGEAQATVMTAGVAVVYAGASSANPVVDVISPGQQMQVVARSAGGEFLALAGGQGWVAASAIQSGSQVAGLPLANQVASR